MIWFAYIFTILGLFSFPEIKYFACTIGFLALIMFLPAQKFPGLEEVFNFGFKFLPMTLICLVLIVFKNTPALA